MIQHLNYKAEDGVLIEADVNDIHKEIRFSDIEPFWSCANEEVFENGRADKIKGGANTWQHLIQTVNNEYLAF